MERNDRHGRIGRTGIAAALLLLGLGGAMPTSAQNVTSTKPVTSSVLLPVLASGPESTVVVSPGPCMPTVSTERVSLTGNLHVVTLVRQGMLTEVHLNIAGVQGIGQTTGNLYIGTGSQKLSYAATPIPVGNSSLQLPPASFTLEHTDGCAADTLFVLVNLNFNTAGEIPTGDPGGTAGCTGGFCPGNLQ